MEKRKIRIGQIGCGWMGTTHANAYKTMRYMGWRQHDFEPVLQLVGGKDLEEGQEAAARFGFERYCGGWQDVVSAADVDVVDNVTPDPLHVEPSIAAAKNGKHIICEKPLAVSAADAKRMLDAVKEAGVKSACGFCYRFFPAVRLAHDLIQEGKLGKIYHFSGKYFQDQGSHEDVAAEDIWYIGWSGVGQGITSHMIDMSRFLIGEVTSVQGMRSTYNKTRPSKKGGTVDVSADEGFFSLVQFSNGASGIYESLGVANGKRNQFSFEIYGSKGSLMWDVAEPNYLHVFLDDTSDPRVKGFTKVNVTETCHPLTQLWWPQGHVLGWEHGHINMLAHFLDCVANDKPVAPLGGTFEDGYIVAKIIEAIEQSSRTGMRIHL